MPSLLVPGPILLPPSPSPHSLSVHRCNMASQAHNLPSRRRLVGQPLLYTMTCFISLGVFLVRPLLRVHCFGSESLQAFGRSLAMTKGTSPRVLPFFYCSILDSVMSGIITGPYFRKYFNNPTALQVGTMVAVLEIGAFGTSWLVLLFSFPSLCGLCSHCIGSRPCRRYHRKEGNIVQWSCCVHHRWRHPDMVNWLLPDDRWPRC